MTFLPIVERELRVAARRLYTYWSRVAAAAFVLLFFGLILTTTMVARGGFPWSVGLVEFSVLKWLAFVFACSTGVYLTSDSLSEEKREGTIGLLFLTDLRGHDVVLGKLMSSSLQAIYGLLAAFPILALPLLMGGVTGAEFGRSLLVICNTLFLSLAVGMIVSSLSREAIKAMNGVLFLTLAFLLLLPWIDLAHAGNTSRFHPIFSHASPGYLFAMQNRMPPGDFWFELGLQHFLGWSLLALACLFIPRSWQEKSTNAKGPRQSLANFWRFGGKRARMALRQKLLDRNPILWLALRDRWLARLMWLVMAAVLAICGWHLCDVYLNGANVGDQTANAVNGVFDLLLLLWVSSQACRLFVEAVRNGAMELILVTPINPRQIVLGQWRALWRTFLIPAIFMVLLQTVPLFETMMQPRTGPSVVYPGGFNQLQYRIVSLVSGIIHSLSSFVALAWFGMWMGLTTRKTTIAVLKTFCFVSVLPWFAEIFLQIFFQVFALTMIVKLFGSSAAAKWPFWAATVAASLFELGKNIFFIVLSRNRLLNHFRELAAQSASSATVRSPQPMPVVLVTSAAHSLGP